MLNRRDLLKQSAALALLPVIKYLPKAKEESWYLDDYISYLEFVKYLKTENIGYKQWDALAIRCFKNAIDICISPHNLGYGLAFKNKIFDRNITNQEKLANNIKYLLEREYGITKAWHADKIDIYYFDKPAKPGMWESLTC